MDEWGGESASLESCFCPHLNYKGYRCAVLKNHVKQAGSVIRFVKDKDGNQFLRCSYVVMGRHMHGVATLVRTICVSHGIFASC